MDELKITKVKLSDGSIYSFFDSGALRLDENNILITGNQTVDEIIISKGLTISEIDDVPVTESIYNVLTQDPVTKKIKKRNISRLLKDAGGISYNENDLSEGILNLQIGAQNNEN